ncbi:MAG: TusE/DsrC/DsvC family sulfur relay protein [Desulfobacterales bacterium]|nr:TusE/DsrC/DsvC family sulfur relay protein [Desulfobacterales bacterium]
MKIFSYNNQNYQVDDYDFLCDYETWDQNFAEGMALNLQISNKLSNKQWEVINYIRDQFEKTGECPLSYKTCKDNGLSTKEFKALFPKGYMRGACKIAGITYKDHVLHSAILKRHRGACNLLGITCNNIAEEKTKKEEMTKKVYRVDIYGFLVDPKEWDETYAIYKAEELKLASGLTEQHWNIINYLRSSFEKNKSIPTLFDCCEANALEIEDLEKLFPDGYQRGAVKIAGLRIP